MRKRKARVSTGAIGKQKQTQETLTNSVLQFIEAYIDEHHFSPSVREIGENCLIGRTTVTRYLDRLEAQGRIRRELGIARSITLVKRHH
jgi:DNA-binding MarR family transcriptional regulator